MVDFSKEIEAYALQNAIEFDKADPGKILPKLFQHGLKKEEIKKVMPSVIEIVKKVNKLGKEERVKAFQILENRVIKHEEKERVLPELPNPSKNMVFRFAPFPSGALHIGNAKTYLLNALYAEKYKAKTLMVIDDTIGSEEKQPIKESYGLILEAAKLLDVKYEKPIYYKSDRLKIYYEYAEKLIEKDKAYVCYCIQDVLRDNRVNGVECGCRKFPREIQKGRWKEMFKEEEGHAVLRIKTNMQDPNPAFRDRVLFKISDRKHPRVGNKYRVWPTLEMSWAIDDHLLGVTHILRGNDLMIETDMEKYIWDIFKWKHPETIHTGLIKIEGMGAKISKSKGQKEIREGTFTGWDDPRTWSIQSLIRRGIRKEAIRAFVEEIGLNKQDITVPIESLYAHNRRLIDAETLRFYFVENPAIFSAPEELKDKKILVPIHPDSKETRTIVIDNIAISGKDFKEYKEQEIRLLHMCNVTFENEIEVTSYENKKIPRIQWVSNGTKARILMPDGTWIEGLCEKASVGKGVKKGTVIQFERVGFVRYDRMHAGKAEFWFAHG